MCVSVFECAKGAYLGACAQMSARRGGARV